MGDNVPDGVHGGGKDPVLVIDEAEGALQLIGVRIEDSDLPASDIPFQQAHGDDGQTVVVDNTNSGVDS